MDKPKTSITAILGMPKPDGVDDSGGDADMMESMFKAMQAGKFQRAYDILKDVVHSCQGSADDEESSEGE